MLGGGRGPPRGGAQEAGRRESGRRGLPTTGQPPRNRHPPGRGPVAPCLSAPGGRDELDVAAAAVDVLLMLDGELRRGNGGGGFSVWGRNRPRRARAHPPDRVGPTRARMASSLPGLSTPPPGPVTGPREAPLRRAGGQITPPAAGAADRSRAPRAAPRTCRTRSFLSLVKGFFSSDQRAKNLLSGPVWMPLSASASPYHLPAVSLNSPADPSFSFQLDLCQRFSQPAAIRGWIGALPSRGGGGARAIAAGERPRTGSWTRCHTAHPARFKWPRSSQTHRRTAPQRRPRPAPRPRGTADQAGPGRCRAPS